MHILRPVKRRKIADNDGTCNARLLQRGEQCRQGANIGRINHEC